MPVTIHHAVSDLSAEEIARWRNVPVAVAVDLGGRADQIDPAIRPLLPAGRQARLFGRAVTAWCEPPDFGAVPHAIDRIGPGEVLVIAAGGHAETAMIGEILTGQLRRRGAAGLVCDGAIRDVGTLAQWAEFPVFARHVTPRGPASAGRGFVGGPVVVGGAIVRPGDLVIGDDDGLVVLAPDVVRTRIAEVEAKIELEARWQAALAAGQSLAQALGLAAPDESEATPPSPAAPRHPG